MCRGRWWRFVCVGGELLLHLQLLGSLHLHTAPESAVCKNCTIIQLWPPPETTSLESRTLKLCCGLEQTALVHRWAACCCSHGATHYPSNQNSSRRTPLHRAQVNSHAARRPKYLGAELSPEPPSSWPSTLHPPLPNLHTFISSLSFLFPSGCLCSLYKAPEHYQNITARSMCLIKKV